MCFPLGVQERYALRLLGAPHPLRHTTKGPGRSCRCRKAAWCQRGMEVFPLSGCAARPRWPLNELALAGG